MALLGLIGNPQNRRLKYAADAATRSNWRSVNFAWEDFPAWLDELNDCDLLRIDSAGENEKVSRQLIAAGGGPANVAMAHGELACLNEHHQGFCTVLDQLERGGHRFMIPPADIKSMFDKWICHQRFVKANILRPKSFMAEPDAAEFVAGIRAQRSGRLFLKPLHGSSASGVLALRWQADRMQIIAPIEIVHCNDGCVRFFNNLRLQSYQDVESIMAILNHLLPQGMIAEQWLPKVKIDGRNSDLRILVVAGQARHLVVRKSHQPMTNLHLGNERDTEQSYIEAFGSAAVNACRSLAEQAAACFPESLYAGVDVMLTPALEPVVIEINAFGDLLPGIVHRGESTYVAIMNAAVRKTHHSVSHCQ